MAKGVRKTIILNENNPKEKLILDVLAKQYNYSQFIKDVLYKNIIDNNILHDGNYITTSLSHNGNTMTIPLSSNDNKMITQLQDDNNTITTQLSCNSSKNLQVNLDNISDDSVEIDMNTEEDPSKNAIDFLKNSF